MKYFLHNVLTFSILEHILVFSEDAHAPPALLPILLVLHDVLASQILHASPLPRNGGVDNDEWLGVAQVEVLPMPGHREET
jgi:hypothetical protein